MSPKSPGRRKSNRGTSRDDLLKELNTVRDKEVGLLGKISGVGPDDKEIKALHDKVISRRVELPNKGDELQVQKEELTVRIEKLEARLEELRRANDELELNITQRKRGEGALRESEQRFRATFEQAGAGIAQLDLEGRFLRINRKYCDMLGYTRNEMLQRTSQSITYHEDLDIDLDQSRRLSAGEISAYSIEKRYVRKNGSLIWVLLTMSLERSPDGSPMYFIKVAQDITERKRAGEILRLSRETYRDLVENVNSIILRWDMDGNIRFFNDYAERFFGYTRGEILGRNIVGTIVPESDTTGRDLVGMTGEIKKHPERYKANINENMRRNGERVWISWTNKAIIDDHGNVVEILSVGNDITSLKQAEESLRLSEERFKQLADKSPIAMAINDRDDNITYLNKKFVDVFGYTLEDIPHLNDWWPRAYPDPDYRKDAIERWERGVENAVKKNTEIGPIDYLVTCKDGSLRNVEISGVAIGDKELITLQDVTERKRAEDAVRVSDIRFRSLIQNSSDIIRILDKGGRIIFDSPSSEKILGYPAGHTLGRSPLEFIHPDDRDRMKASLGEIYDSRNPGSPTEFRIRKADGEYLDVESVGVNMIGVPGVDGIVVTTRPITERKRAEEALRENETRLAAGLDAVTRLQQVGMRFVQEGDLAALLDDILDAAISIAGTDKGTLQLLKPGVEYLEIVSQRGFEKSYVDFFSSVSHTSAAVCGVAMGKSERVIVEDVARSPIFIGTPALEVQLAAGVRAVQSTPLVNRRGQVIGILTTHWSEVHRPDENVLRYIDLLARQAADIIERKWAEDALRETSDYLESLINYANAPIIVWSPDFKITRFNHAFERLTGFSSGDVVGRELEILFPPDSIEKSLVRIKRTLAGEYMESVEVPILRKDEATRIVLWNSANIYDKDGETLMATIAQGQDITERKRAEEELSEAKDQAELYLDLMGHDISNMHQIIMGQLELAKDIMDADCKLDAVDRELIDTSLDTLERSSKLIENVRNLQRLRRGEFNEEVLDPGDLISAVILEYEKLLPGGSIEFVRDGRHTVRANKLLHDVFTNLVGNAIKHSNGADIAIRVKLEDAEDGDKKYSRVSIEDNGPGIPDEMKDKIFNRLQRGETKARGMGLGLYLVKSLVDSFHGRVWVEDRVRGDHTKGSRFVVMLPTAQ